MVIPLNRVYCKHSIYHKTPYIIGVGVKASSRKRMKKSCCCNPVAQPIPLHSQYQRQSYHVENLYLQKLHSSKGQRQNVFVCFFYKIFSWRQCYPHTSFTYILSKDIFRHTRCQKDEADVLMVKGKSWCDKNIKIVAAGSNDSGVS